MLRIGAIIHVVFHTIIVDGTGIAQLELTAVVFLLQNINAQIVMTINQSGIRKCARIKLMVPTTRQGAISPAKIGLELRLILFVVEVKFVAPKIALHIQFVFVR